MTKRVLPKKSGNILITSAMLYKVRDELKHDNVSFRLEVNSKFKEVDARFDRLESKVELVLSAVQRIGLLVEEQNVRNKFVLDGYTNLHDRVERLEENSND